MRIIDPRTSTRRKKGERDGGSGYLPPPGTWVLQRPGELSGPEVRNGDSTDVGLYAVQGLDRGDGRRRD